MSQEPKKNVRRKISKKALAVIIILLIILLAMVGFAYFDYRQTTANILDKQNLARELEPDTALVERGDLSNTLEDISGIVRSNQSVYLYWQTSGTVSDVYVEVGDKVSKGDVLAELDRKTIDSAIIDAEVTREQAEESMERLYTSALPLEQARTAMVQAKKAVEDAQKELDALGLVRSDLIELGVKYDDYQRSITAYENAKKFFDSVKERALDDAVRVRALSAMESAKSTMDSLKAQYGWYSGEAEEIDIQKADAALKLAQAQLDDAVRAYNRIKDGPTENQVRSIQAQIDAAAATVNTSKIISPISGTVAQVEAKPYDVISYDTAQTGTILAVRVDDLTSHYIDISVTELEINNIHLGQEVAISFDAIPLRQYTGTIVNISNAGTVDNLSVNFDLTVKMDETDDSIKSGMMADVAIVTRQARDTLYVPQKAITVADDGTTRIVQKQMADGSFVDIPVVIGITSGDNVQITTDQLSEGDTVKLNKVTSALSGDFRFGNMININVNGLNNPGGNNRPGGRPQGQNNSPRQPR